MIAGSEAAIKLARRPNGFIAWSQILLAVRSDTRARPDTPLTLTHYLIVADSTPQVTRTAISDGDWLFPRVADAALIGLGSLPRSRPRALCRELGCVSPVHLPKRCWSGGKRTMREWNRLSCRTRSYSRYIGRVLRYYCGGVVTPFVTSPSRVSTLRKDRKDRKDVAQTLAILPRIRPGILGG